MTDQPRVALLPCPFCGSNEHLTFRADANQGGKWGSVFCGSCAVTGPEVRTHYGPENEWAKSAAEEWNVRPPGFDAGYAAAIDDAAAVADGFTCGGCGMDGKAGKAIRDLAAHRPGRREDGVRWNRAYPVNAQRS